MSRFVIDVRCQAGHGGPPQVIQTTQTTVVTVVLPEECTICRDQRMRAEALMSELLVSMTNGVSR